ncbi:MAG: nucleotidyltransferase domain-containing protein [Elusimicrobia bacterium]|nr:nucleotidyltransferase domain-containing protein [Candidatus Liberimonas magnetica]
MAKRTIIRAKDLLFKLFRERDISLEKVVVFGSYAKKTARPDSDLDIIVVSRAFRDKDIFKRVELASGISGSLVHAMNKPIDLMFYSDKEWESGSSIIMNTAKHEGLVFSK